jgi:hypothetical protein
MPIYGNRRCGARLKSNLADHCMKWAVPGKTRCHLHGGSSTGPRLGFRPSAKNLEARVEGRRIWLAMLKADGRKAPCGRKPKDYRPLFSNPKALLEQKARKERHVLEIVLALAVKTLSNYSNHLFHTPLDHAFASRAWKKRA